MVSRVLVQSQLQAKLATLHLAAINEYLNGLLNM